MLVNSRFHVCVCVYVRVYVCVKNGNKCVYMCVCLLICAFTFVSECVCVCVCVCVCGRTLFNLRSHVRVRMCVSVRACVCMCVCGFLTLSRSGSAEELCSIDAAVSRMNTTLATRFTRTGRHDVIT